MDDAAGVAAGGTSAATAYASGVAAQILSLAPETTPAQLRLALTTTGPALSDPRNGITRHRIDALAAYEEVATGCFPGPTTLCIDDEPSDRRFRVEVAFYTNDDLHPASPVHDTDSFPCGTGGRQPLFEFLLR